MVRVGIDIGGTFTDLYAWDKNAEESQKVHMAKVLSTPNDLVIGIMNALSESGISPSDIDTVIHGTTVGTNALIERSFPEPALIATSGFRDIIEIGRQSRIHLYDPYGKKPSPLISRNRRFSVNEKLGVDGSTVKPLDREGALEVVHEIAEQGIKNIAVTFINSYVDGRHEQEMRDLILEVIPDAEIALSSETSPKVRELGRFVTTAIRASLFPVIGDYLTRLESALKEAGCTAPLFIVKSNGGMMRSEAAKEHPEELIASGPAGGIAAASYMHDLLDLDNMIVTDVGGTSFEASLVENGQGLVTDEYELEWEMPVTTPMLDIRSIGAGGGSIAWIDEGNSLRVGPKSAGATPGPACYGRGGTQPTVTDANLVLGRLNPTLSGKFQLDVEAAVNAIKTVADPLGLSVIECAEGIIKIVCENMADAIRMVSTDRGRDPRDQVYVSFGGAGGLHAFKVAEAAGINRIIIPPFVGVDCATGATTMDVRHDIERTFYGETAEIDPQTLDAAYRKLEEECRQLVENDGISSDKVTFERTALMRYVGQSYEVATPVVHESITEESLVEIEKAFNKEHKREYGVANESFPSAFVTLRVTGFGEISKPEENALMMSLGTKNTQQVQSNEEPKQRDIYFEGEKHAVNIYDIDSLTEDQEVHGPAIIQHPNSEIVVPPAGVATINKHGFIDIALDEAVQQSSVKNKEVIQS